MRYDPAGTECAKGPQPGAKALRAWCMARWSHITDLGIFNCRPVRGGTTLSLHGEGRAWDAGLNANIGAQKQQGDEVFAWAIANAATIHLQEAIWDRRQWSSRHPLIRPYNGQSAHRDHVHLGLNWHGARNLTAAVLDTTLTSPPQEDPFDMMFKDQTDARRWLVRDTYLNQLLRPPSAKDMTDGVAFIASNGADAFLAAVSDSPEAKKVRDKQRTRLGV